MIAAACAPRAHGGGETPPPGDDAGAGGAADAGAEMAGRIDGGTDGAGLPPTFGDRTASSRHRDVHDTCATRTSDGWCWVSPRPQGITLADVSSPRAGELWGVGASGTVLHGAGGAWQLVDVGLTDALTAVSATAGGAVWIGSERGAIVRGDAGGWVTLPSPGLAKVTAIWAADRDDAWVAGGAMTLFHWTEARGWTAVNPSLFGDVTVVTGRGPDDVWMVTDSGRFARWQQQSTWTRGDIDLHVPSQTFFSRMGTLDDGTVWASARGDAGESVAYVFDGAAWRPAAGDAYALAGASLLDYWSTSYRGNLMHVTADVPMGTNAASLGTGGLVTGRADDVWATSSDGWVRHGDASTWGWEEEPALFHRPGHVWVSSSNDVWTTALFGDAEAGVAHWDGAGWELFAFGDREPSPPVVAANAIGDVWLAGLSLWHLETDVTGVRVLQELPYPGRPPAGDGWSARCLAVTPAGVAWVLGSYAAGGDALLRFDGRSWRALDLPAGFLPYRDGMSLRATPGRDDDLWLISRRTVYHYDGTRWSSPVELPSALDMSGIRDIWPLGPDDVWAGSLHFDGQRWIETSPIYAAGEIYSTWARADDDVWIMSSTGLRRWDGRAWSGPLSVPVSSTGMISATSSDDLWISGWSGIIHGSPTRPAPR